MTGTKIFETPTDDGSKIRTVIDFSPPEDGKIEKRVTKYKLYKSKTKISKAVIARREWTKFGDAAKKGAQEGTTTVGDLVPIETTARKQKDREEESKRAAMEDKVGKAEPWIRAAQRLGAASWDEITGPRGDAGSDAAASSSGNVFVPRSIRTGARKPGEAGGPHERDDSCTIRITNLSEDTREDDLKELCRRFGAISRTFIAKDKITNISRGFAFVTFVYREDAARAIEGLQGYGYDHLILNVEWARPSTAKPY